MGPNGMFIPFDNQTNFISLLLGNEVYYFIGDMNASQHYVLMANTFSPRCESSRMIRRMAETNIVNGEYAAAGKYLKILSQTLFYRRWAHKMEQYLYHDELCSKTPWIAYKRAQMPVIDHIESNPNGFTGSLYYLLDDHPNNQAALDYLLSICLLNKDLDRFYKALTIYKYRYSNAYLPKLYQEALIIYYDLHRGDKNLKDLRLSGEVIRKAMQFKEKLYQTSGDERDLIKNFGDTYWFYYSFAV